MVAVGIERMAADGTVTPIVERYQGHRFNSPNDVIVRSDGSIWFSDPTYGIMQRPGRPRGGVRGRGAGWSTGSTRGPGSSTR